MSQPAATPPSSQPPVGVLLMAYGSPESVEDMEPYLLDIRGGRPTPHSLVEEMSERYMQIGGRSPLFERTREQGQALEDELNRRYAGQGLRFRTYLGMRHWQPRIKEAVVQMQADGIRQVIALVMAPHASRLSTGAYFSRLEQDMTELGADFTVQRIESWHDHPGLIDAIAEHAIQAWQKFSQPPFVIFSAHSLPSRILAQGDPYDSQLRHTAQLLAERLSLAEGRWQFSYQSAGASAEPWLGPQIEDVVADLSTRGEKHLLVVPVGFVCDHVEVLYDIDIACRQLAEQNGAHLERSASLNAAPKFIAALVDLVAGQVAQLDQGARQPSSG